MSNTRTIGSVRALAAVKKDGLLLRDVIIQNPLICMTAVMQNPHALQYVDDQTPDICLAALKGEKSVFDFVKSPTLAIYFEAASQYEGRLNVVKNAQQLEHSAESENLDSALAAKAADLDADEIATYLADRIENGQMRLEDIPIMMARYALADPAAMRLEFAERITNLDDGGCDADAPSGT